MTSATYLTSTTSDTTSLQFSTGEYDVYVAALDKYKLTSDKAFCGSLTVDYGKIDEVSSAS